MSIQFIYLENVVCSVIEIIRRVFGISILIYIIGGMVVLSLSLFIVIIIKRTPLSVLSPTYQWGGSLICKRSD